jgi:hypothetical protein
MDWRGSAAVVLLLGVGIGGGYAAAAALEEAPAASGPATPVPAVSPSVPVDPPATIRPDPDVPALDTDLRTRREQLGTGGFAVSLPVPVGWQRTDLASAEAKWDVAGHPLNTYWLRVEQVSSQRESIPTTVEERVADLDATTEGFVIVEQTDESLSFTYLADGYLRYGHLRWLDLTGSGIAELEIATTGREVDVPGMEALVDTVAEGARG